MKQLKLSRQKGYMDLMLPRVFGVIVLLLGLLAGPELLDYRKAQVLMPVLDEVQESVAGYFQEHKSLHELSDMQELGGSDYIDVASDRVRIELTLIDPEMTGKYLVLAPTLESGSVVWRCGTEGELYKGDIPYMRDGICADARAALEKRGVIDRMLFRWRDMWVFIGGMLAFVFLTIILN